MLGSEGLDHISQGQKKTPTGGGGKLPEGQGQNKERLRRGGLFLAVRQEALDFVDFAGGDKSRATKAAFALGAFFGQDVAAEGFGSTDFSAPGVTKAFFCTARGFEFGHSESPNQEEQEAGGGEEEEMLGICVGGRRILIALVVVVIIVFKGFEGRKVVVDLLAGATVFAWFGSQDHDHRAPFHFGGGFDKTILRDIFDHFFKEFETLLFVGDLTAAKFDGDFGFVAFVKKTLDVPDLEVDVVFIRFRAELNFFDLDLCRVFLGFFRFLLLLVLVLPVVHQLADGGTSSSSDFDQINASFFGHTEGLLDQDDPDLRSVLVDQADFFDPDTLVDTRFLIDGSLLSHKEMTAKADPTLLKDISRRRRKQKKEGRTPLVGG